MTRPEDRSMVGWDEIRCSNPEPHEHRTRTVTVDLRATHGYADYPQVPGAFAPTPFQMEVWDWRAAPANQGQEVGLYCPAADPVSETIAVHGIWEPPETIALLELFYHAFTATGRPWQFIDVGAQLGWYSVLAARWGLDVLAMEADPDVGAVLLRNLDRNAAGGHVTVDPSRVPDHVFLFDEMPTIAKIDIEGAEMAALLMLEDDLIAPGHLKALLIELSPVFGVDTDGIVEWLMSKHGFNARWLPPKNIPPIPVDVTRPAWTDWEQVADAVRDHEQINVLFARG